MPNPERDPSLLAIKKKTVEASQGVVFETGEQITELHVNALGALVAPIVERYISERQFDPRFIEIIYSAAAVCPTAREAIIGTAVQTSGQESKVNVSGYRLAEIIYGLGDFDLSLTRGEIDDCETENQSRARQAVMIAAGQLLSYEKEALSLGGKMKVLQAIRTMERERDLGEEAQAYYLQAVAAAFRQPELVAEKSFPRQELITEAIDLASEGTQKSALTILSQAEEEELTAKALGLERYISLIKFIEQVYYSPYTGGKEELERGKKVLEKLPVGDLATARAVLANVVNFQSSFTKQGSRKAWEVKGVGNPELTLFSYVLEKHFNSLGQEDKTGLLELDQLIKLAADLLTLSLSGDEIMIKKRVVGEIVQATKEEVLETACSQASNKESAAALLRLLAEHRGDFLRTETGEGKPRWVSLAEKSSQIPLGSILSGVYRDDNGEFIKACLTSSQGQQWIVFAGLEKSREHQEMVDRGRQEQFKIARQTIDVIKRRLFEEEDEEGKEVDWQEAMETIRTVLSPEFIDSAGEGWKTEAQEWRLKTAGEILSGEVPIEIKLEIIGFFDSSSLSDILETPAIMRILEDIPADRPNPALESAFLARAEPYQVLELISSGALHDRLAAAETLWKLSVRERSRFEDGLIEFLADWALETIRTFPQDMRDKDRRGREMSLLKKLANNYFWRQRLSEKDEAISEFLEGLRTA